MHEKLRRKKIKWRQTGEAPDYRFSLANERTYLAWIRTALALLAGAIAVDQLTPDLANPLCVAFSLPFFVPVQGCSPSLPTEDGQRMKLDEEKRRAQVHQLS
ncbi:inner membrane protein [Vibrio sp. JCM 19236]|nr:inner membrane protein [Vibrio sp. JCM 19236]